MQNIFLFNPFAKMRKEYRVPKQQMLIRYCSNYIIIVVLYIYSTRILRIILYYIAIEGSGASISLMSNNAQPITLLF